MKEHSLLLKGPMVLATRDDRKIQTRRIITRMNSLVGGSRVGKALWERLEFDDEKSPGDLHVYVDQGPSPAGNPGPYLHVPMRPHPEDSQTDPDLWTVHRVYPIYQPGDRIWFKETWAPHPESPRCRIAYRADMTSYGLSGGWAAKTPEYPDHGTVCPERIFSKRPFGMAWKPSIFMPRWASRLVVDVEKALPERIQEISAFDCLSEGIDLPPNNGCQPANFPVDFRMWSQKRRDEWIDDHTRSIYFAQCADCDDHVTAFRDLWESINAERGHPWSKNDWVWAIHFNGLGEKAAIA